MSVLVYVAGFVALAVVFALVEHRWRLRRQPTVRADAGTDLLHAVFSNAAPAAAFEALAYAALARLSPGVSMGLFSDRPLALQLALLVALTEVSFYLVHRAMHRSRRLWRLHEVHHSAAEMDWLSGYRKHALETVLHVAVPFLPIALLGFSPTAWLIFGLIGLAFAGFTHLNTRLELRWLEPLVVTPRYHAWHHASDPAAQQTNFAGKLSILDRLFGTARADDAGAVAWPPRLGLDDARYPRGFLAQQRRALRRR